ncbi:MAG: class I SAM-dependent methyltransferase [Bacteroidota bacterium]
MKLSLIPRIKELYDQKVNIIQYLRGIENRKNNSIEDILISYDFQAGSYIEIIENDLSYITAYTDELFKIINTYCTSKHTILEVGVGEATTLCHLRKLFPSEAKFYGFDISWSRISKGVEYLKRNNVEASLFVSDLFLTPLADSSIDVVYSSHSLEPNGGKEIEALKELYRITKDCLILLEPASEFADSSAKKRMEENGYISNLHGKIMELGYDLKKYELFPVTAHNHNPTGLYVIKKNNSQPEAENMAPFTLRCPLSKEALVEYPDHFFSPSSLISYPKIDGIPCLLIDYGILTSKHQ